MNHWKKRLENFSRGLGALTIIWLVGMLLISASSMVSLVKALGLCLYAGCIAVFQLCAGWLNIIYILIRALFE